jgi:hypothetical protein
MVQRVIALGISEIGLCHSTRQERRPVFERVARDVIAGLKARHTAARRR